MIDWRTYICQLCGKKCRIDNDQMHVLTTNTKPRKTKNVCSDCYQKNRRT